MSHNPTIPFPFPNPEINELFRRLLGEMSSANRIQDCRILVQWMEQTSSMVALADAAREMKFERDDYYPLIESLSNRCEKQEEVIEKIADMYEALYDTNATLKDDLRNLDQNNPPECGTPDEVQDIMAGLGMEK